MHKLLSGIAAIAVAAGITTLTGTGSAHAAVVEYRGGGAVIADLATSYSRITVADDFLVTDVDVIFDGLTHSLPREVQLFLEKDGLSRRLIFNKDVARNNFGDPFTFDDEASAPISAWTGGGSSFRPVDALSAFDGASAAGEWRIRAYDSAAGDTGSYRGWTLRLSNANVGAVPEPAGWAMMISGFGLVGGAMRRRVPVRAFA